jgi:hypothetical protein
MGFLSAYCKWFRRPGEPFGVRSISRNTVIPVLAKATNIHILYKLVCIGDMTWDLLQKSSLLVAVCFLFQLLVQAICSSFYSIICKLLTSLQAWLLFFYTSLALRENILRVNGSDIRPWYVHLKALLVFNLLFIVLIWQRQNSWFCSLYFLYLHLCMSCIGNQSSCGPIVWGCGHAIENHLNQNRIVLFAKLLVLEPLSVVGHCKVEWRWLPPELFQFYICIFMVTCY